jgi:RNase adapter protein RapZ
VTKKPVSARRRTRKLRRAGSSFVVLTGLSGSGKSQAIRALEDLGYFCVDNLPITLIPTLADLSGREGFSRVAIVVDVREKGFAQRFPKVLTRLRAMRGLDPALIFLEASNAALVRRFSETRRPHPLAPTRSAAEGIREERASLDMIRRLADEVIDTSDMTVHDLRQAFKEFATGVRKRVPLVVTLLSFGYKFGVPMDADLVFDVRFLPNPHFVRDLKPRTGRDGAVVRFMRRYKATRDLLSRLTGFLKFMLPQYVSEGKTYLTIAIGCTGGRHRSVMVAEALRKDLGGVTGVRVRVVHRDVVKDA